MEQSCSAQRHSKHTQQPAMDEDEAYMRHLELVNAGAPVLSGTQPESNPESFNYSRFVNEEENLVAREQRRSSSRRCTTWQRVQY